MTTSWATAGGGHASEPPPPLSLPRSGGCAVVELIAAADALRIPAVVDLAAIVVGALTGGLLAAREGFAVSGVLLLAVTGGLGGGVVPGGLLGPRAPVGLPPQTYPPPGAGGAPRALFFSRPLCAGAPP